MALPVEESPGWLRGTAVESLVFDRRTFRSAVDLQLIRDHFICG